MFTVRRAMKGDENKIAELLTEICEQHRAGRPDLFTEGAAKYNAREVADLFGNDDSPIFVAVDGNGVIGYLMAQLKRPVSAVIKGYSTLYIDDLNVDKASRRLGVGKALTDAAVAYAKQNDCYNITLNVWEFNTGALEFYKTYGFFTQCRHMELIVK